MTGVRESVDVSGAPSLARHLELSPVAFAVTEGPEHVVRYANAAFRELEASGAIGIGVASATGRQPPADLTDFLDRAYQGALTITDELLPHAAGDMARWSCSVWPVSSDPAAPGGLVMEVRDAAENEEAKTLQRNIAERLLIGALREQETAKRAIDAGRRATFLASASRDLAMSLDEEATRAVVQRRSLPRTGAWCIVDLVEADGTINRLPVAHPSPAKTALARELGSYWQPPNNSSIGVGLAPVEHDPKDLEILRSLGFGPILVVPLVVRATILGAITFVTRENDPPFSSDEITLASELADRCALALDNARLYREADALRVTADLANRAKSMFLGNMSHELRTPLNAIGGYADLIEMGLRGPVTSEQRLDLTRIKNSQQHLLTMITEILNFVRSESGRLEYHFADVPIHPVLTDVSEMLAGAITERKLTLDLGADDLEAVAWADPERVRQILMNLVVNAVKYTADRGTSITLSTEVLPETVVIHVADDGPGIPADKLEVIFEPFVQLGTGLANRQGGVGLGLPISRDIARAMHGDITVESTVGVGSRFTLTLRRTKLGFAPG